MTNKKVSDMIKLGQRILSAKQLQESTGSSGSVGQASVGQMGGRDRAHSVE